MVESRFDWTPWLLYAVWVCYALYTFDVMQLCIIYTTEAVTFCYYFELRGIRKKFGNVK